MNILVVDDDKRLLAEIERILSQNGHSVDCANNADEAVVKVGSKSYDLVLVDYRMPEHDGMWFMQNAAIPRQTKVLLVTSYVERHIITQMFHAGISGYVVKPFDEKELLMHLDFHMNKRKNQYDVA